MLRRLFISLLCIANLLPVHAQVVGHLPDFLPRYKLITNFWSGIQDQSAGILLLQNQTGDIHHFDLASKTLSLLATNYHTGYSTRLLPNGFLLHSTNGLLQIEGAKETNLGAISLFLPNHGSLVLEGRFGILQTAEGLALHDFTAHTNLVLTRNAGFVDVSANGSVVFTEFKEGTNVAVRRFHEGQFKTLAVLPQFPHPYIATDGTNVLWSEPSFPFGSVMLHTPTEARIELSTNTALAVTGWPPIAWHKNSVAMKDGWTIFPRWAPNNPVSALNLWRRSPTGEIAQLTTRPAFVLAMGDDGSAIIEGGDGRIESGLYYIPASGEPKPLGGSYALARYFAVGNKFYAYSPLQSGPVGLFEIELSADPFVMIYPSYDLTTGKFIAHILPSMPGTFVLERTTDFTEWTTVETYPLEHIGGHTIELTTPPGFFRLRSQQNQPAL